MVARARGVGGRLWETSDSVVRHAMPCLVVAWRTGVFPTNLVEKERQGRQLAARRAIYPRAQNLRCTSPRGFERRRMRPKGADTEVAMIRESGAQDTQAQLELMLTRRSLTWRELGAG